MSQERGFSDYQNEAAAWITLATGDYYPDILNDACRLYEPVLVEFGQLLQRAHSSEFLFKSIAATPNQWMRIQLCRVFKKYVSPQTPVEMLKVKNKATHICEQFGSGFRHIAEVQQHFNQRPMPDETLCALLWEYKDRGKKGYDLTERAFDLLRSQHPDCTLIGDDRTGQYREVAQEIISYADAHGMSHIKIVYVNDGPGLLLGSMWRDYAYLETRWTGRVKVVTLRMIPERITAAWLRS